MKTQTQLLGVLFLEGLFELLRQEIEIVFVDILRGSPQKPHVGFAFLYSLQVLQYVLIQILEKPFHLGLHFFLIHLLQMGA